MRIVSTSDAATIQDDLQLSEEDLAAAEKAFNAKLGWKKTLGLILLLVAAFCISFMMGRYSFSVPNILAAIPDHFRYLYNIYIVGMSENAATLLLNDVNMDTALFNIRFPRIIMVLLVGAALSAAGASYQGMFKNPLVSPDLLGASTGASFGACLALLLNLSNLYIQLFAFVGGLTAVGLVMLLNKAIRSDALLGLVLGGILVSSLFQSGSSIIKLVADADDKLPSITFWLMGSFAGITISDLLLALLPMAIGFVLILSQRWKLNVLSFGEEEAKSLGINTASTRFIVILGATLITSCSVSVAGVIGWIGLVVPHLARAVVGPNYKVLIPATMLIGSVFLLVVDNFCRLLFAAEIPIGLLTSILGIPFFVFIYAKNMKGW
jgi:iron complex transport system permease protein